MIVVFFVNKYQMDVLLSTKEAVSCGDSLFRVKKSITVCNKLNLCG